MTKRIFDDLYQTIEEVKIRHGNMEHAFPQEKHGFLEGLKVAQQLVVQEQEWCYGDDYAYEKLEEVIKSFQEHSALDDDEIQEIIDANIPTEDVES